jgi:hypothetical protein
MKDSTLKKLKFLLTNRRREILEQVAHLEWERDELGTRSIEQIESAQKDNLAHLIHKLEIFQNPVLKQYRGYLRMYTTICIYLSYLKCYGLARIML